MKTLTETAQVLELLSAEREAREEAEDANRICGIVFWDVIRENVPQHLFPQIDATLQRNARGKAEAMQRIRNLYRRVEASEARAAQMFERTKERCKAACEARIDKARAVRLGVWTVMEQEAMACSKAIDALQPEPEQDKEKEK